MILTALAKLAEDEQLLSVKDYEPDEVRFLVTLGPDGEVRGVRDLRVFVDSVPRSAMFLVSKRSLRTSNDFPEFVVDKAEYVLVGRTATCGPSCSTTTRKGHASSLIGQMCKSTGTADGDNAISQIHTPSSAVW